MLPLTFALFALAIPKPQDVDELRAKAFGIVRNEQGEPWSGATVRLFSRPLGRDSRVGRLDLMEVETDERGRFRAMVLRGRRYSAWAFAGERQTAVVERVFAGDPTELTETRAPAVARRIAVEGLDAWNDRAPLQWHATTSCENAETISGVLGGDGVIELPVLPGGISVVLCDRDGAFLFESSLPTQAKPKIELPPPRKVRARIRVGATENGVAGGAIWWVTNSRAGLSGRWPVASLDAEGRADFMLPIESELHHSNWSFRITSAGYTPGIPAGDDDLSTTDEEIVKWRADGGVFLHSGLTEGRKAKGRLLWRDGTPAAGATIVVENHASSQVSENSYYGSTDPFVLRTDAEGRFSADGLYGDSAIALRLVLTEDIVAKLPTGWRGRVGSLALLQVVPENVRPPGHDFGDIVIDRDVWPLDLELRTAEGLPAANANVVMRASGVEAHTSDFRTGRLGRLCVLVPRRIKLLIGAAHAGGARLASLDFEAIREVEAPERVRISLEAQRDVEVRVVDADGEPVSGASVSLGPEWNQSAPVAALQAVPLPSSGAVKISAVDLSEDQVVNLLWQVLGSRGVTTDADGRAVLAAPAIDAVLSVRAHFQSGREWRHGETTLLLDDGPMEVEIELSGSSK